MYGKLKSPHNLDGNLLRFLVSDLVAQGLTAWVSYDRGYDREDEGFGKLTSNVDELLSALGEADEEHLFIGKDGEEIGWIFLVYGNGPGELISDYTTNLEKILAKTNALAREQMEAA